MALANRVYLHLPNSRACAEGFLLLEALARRNVVLFVFVAQLQILDVYDNWLVEIMDAFALNQLFAVAVVFRVTAGRARMLVLVQVEFDASVQALVLARLKLFPAILELFELLVR